MDVHPFVYSHDVHISTDLVLFASQQIDLGKIKKRLDQIQRRKPWLKLRKYPLSRLPLPSQNYLTAGLRRHRFKLPPAISSQGWYLSMSDEL